MNTDPVIAKIRKQQRLFDLWTAVADDDDDKCTAACAAYNAAFEKLLRTKPRTRAGAAALVKHCLAEDARFPGAPDGGDAVTLLRTLAKALPALA